MKRVSSHLLALVLGLLAVSVAFAQTATVNSLSNVTNRAATYHASILITPVATPTDIFILKGSATKTVFVKSLGLTCLQGTVGTYTPVYLYKRIVANVQRDAYLLSGIAVSAVAADSSDSAATAAPTYYTGNVGISDVSGPILVKGVQLFSSTAASAPPGTPIEQNWGTGMDRYIVLRGVAQGLAVNLAGATVTGATCHVNVSWIER